MKKSLTPLFALAASMVLALTVHAQPGPKVLVVDIAKVFENHYETQIKRVELQADIKKADADIQQMVKAGNDLVDQYKDLVDQSKNPALTPEAKAKVDDDSKKKMDEINTKQNELNSYKQTAQRQFQERVKNINDALIDSISKTATEVAKRHGATLLFDKSGVSAFGANVLIYADPAYDITDEVIKEVNKDRPPSSPGKADAVPAGSSNNEPKLTIPPLNP